MPIAVEICPEEDMDDDKAGLDIEKGCQEVDGKTALGYSRTRKYANGDIQRVQNQREVIGGLGGKLRSPMTVIDPIRYFRVVTGGAASVSVDNTAGVVDMARFALALSGVVEGFVTGQPWPWWLKIGIGALALGVFLFYMLFVGRRAARAGETGGLTAYEAGTPRLVSG